MEFETKYYGILKEFNFDKINIDSFEILLSKNIFDEQELSKCYENDEDYFIKDDYTMEFGDFFIHNRKEYHLKKDIYSEMIYVKNWLLNAFNEAYVLTDEIEIKIASEFHLENKLNILEENFKKYFNQIEDKNYYSLFKNQISTNGFESWEQYFMSDIIDNENYKSVAKFLKGDHKFLNNEIENQWNDYFIFSKISDYCEQTKNLLLNISPKIMEENQNNSAKNIDLSFQIAVLEEIVNMADWVNLSPNEKGKIIHLMIGKNADNIKKIYLSYNKPNTEIKDKYLKDRQKAIDEIKNIIK